MYHFATYLDHVLLQLLGTDIENSLFKYRVSYRHLTFMIETYELLIKSCKNLICYLCIFNVQVYVHLKKWTLKFKLLYLRNCISFSYFNKIHRICCVNTHIQNLNVWFKSVLPWLKCCSWYSAVLCCLCDMLPVSVNLTTHCLSDSNCPLAGATIQGAGDRAGHVEAASFFCRTDSGKVADGLSNVVSCGLSCSCTAGCWDSATQQQVIGITWCHVHRADINCCCCIGNLSVTSTYCRYLHLQLSCNSLTGTWTMLSRYVDWQYECQEASLFDECRLYESNY